MSQYDPVHSISNVAALNDFCLCSNSMLQVLNEFVDHWVTTMRQEREDALFILNLQVRQYGKQLVRIVPILLCHFTILSNVYFILPCNSVCVVLACHKCISDCIQMVILRFCSLIRIGTEMRPGSKGETASGAIVVSGHTVQKVHKVLPDETSVEAIEEL